MFRLFEQQHRPFKIKSLKELEPGFKPRRFRISLRLILIGFLSMPVIVAGSVSKVSLLFWLGVASFHSVIVALIALSVVPRIMSFVGYWWPWAGLKAAQLDSWLERDLHWGK